MLPHAANRGEGPPALLHVSRGFDAEEDQEEREDVSTKEIRHEIRMLAIAGVVCKKASA
jgi:hypothetical protein